MENSIIFFDIHVPSAKDKFEILFYDVNTCLKILELYETYPFSAYQSAIVLWTTIQTLTVALIRLEIMMFNDVCPSSN